MTHNSIAPTAPSLPARPVAGSYHPEDFERLARATLSMAEWDALKDMLGSTHMRSRIMNDPTCATAQQVVALAAILRASPWALHWGFGLGADKVSYEEALMWWLLDEMRANANAIANNDLYEQTQNKLRQELPVIGLEEAATSPHNYDEAGRNDKTPARSLAAAAG